MPGVDEYPLRVRCDSSAALIAKLAFGQAAAKVRLMTYPISLFAVMTPQGPWIWG